MKKAIFTLTILFFAGTLFAEPEPIKFNVRARYSQRDGTWLENVALPFIPGAQLGPDRQWTMQCDQALNGGNSAFSIYEGTWDKAKNQIRVQTQDIKGKPQIVKCKMVSHDWVHPLSN